ncbi:MAG: S41 family peptidase [Candidatus Hodarchaeota archaeon]
MINIRKFNYMICFFISYSIYITSFSYASPQNNSISSLDSFISKLMNAFETKNTKKLMSLVAENIKCYDGTTYNILQMKMNNVFNQVQSINATLSETKLLDSNRHQVLINLELRQDKNNFFSQDIYFIITLRSDGQKITNIFDKSEYEEISEKKFFDEYIMPKEDAQLTSFQRLYGFMRLWSEVKYNFAFFDKVPELNWDMILYEYLARVEQEQTTEEYYRLLQKCIALLHDGHTNVWAPQFGIDKPPIRIYPIQGKAIIVEIGKSKEIEQYNIESGLEITHIEGKSIHSLLEKEIYPYISASTDQARDIHAFDLLLEGPKDTKCPITVKDLEGNVRNIILTRCSSKEQMPWLNRPILEYRNLSDDIAYIAINSFASANVVNEFDKIFEKILHVKGLILDLRNNPGGSSGNAYLILGRLTDKVLEGLHWKTRQYMPAFRAWGRKEKWFMGESHKVNPTGDNPFLGPIVALTGPATGSAAEDFLVALHANGRAILVGEKTAGTTGQPISFRLPGDGEGRVCTTWSTYPDGKEFIGVGIIPDKEIALTQKDIANRYDSVLEKGIEVLKEQF